MERFAETQYPEGKICIPVNISGSGKSLIAEQFNRATKYLVIDPEMQSTKTMTIEEVLFMFSAVSSYGFKDRGISYIIGSGISEHAMSILSANNVHVFEPIGNSVNENVIYLLKAQLTGI